MKWPNFIVLLFALLLVATVVPVDQFVAVFGADEAIKTLDLVGGGDERPLFVEGEVLVKFISRASQSEVAALKASQGVEELGVSVFSGVRRWRVPASRSASIQAE